MLGMNAIGRCAMYAGVAFTAVVLSVDLAVADVCTYKPPKVRRVCGMIVDISGLRIPGVRVTVLKNGAEVKNTTTDTTGEFDFDSMPPDKYELDAVVPGFQHARYQLTLSKPTNTCKHALRIQMTV